MAVSPFARFYADQRDARRVVPSPFAHAVAKNAPSEVARIYAAARDGAEPQELWWRANTLLAAVMRAERAPSRDSDMLAFARAEAEALVEPIDTYWDDYLYRGLDQMIGTMEGSSTEQTESRQDAHATDNLVARRDRADEPGTEGEVSTPLAVGKEQSSAQGEPDRDTADGSASEKPPSPPSKSNGTSLTPGSTLQSDHTLQEALSNELLRMASVLKRNSSEFADALERDRVLVEQASEHLGRNLDLMTRTRGQLGIFSKKARSMGWFTLGSILAVLVSWLMMFVVIRLT